MPTPMPSEQALWLIPSQALRGHARQVWANLHPGVRLPNIMTLTQWASHLAAPDAPAAEAPTPPQPLAAQGLHFNAAFDRPIAQARLARLGLERENLCVQNLLEIAYELAPRVRAIPPADRAAWAGERASALQQGGAYAIEDALALLALEWAVQTHYDTDVLWQQQAAFIGKAAHFYVTHGIAPEPLLQALLPAIASAGKLTVIEFKPPKVSGKVSVTAAADLEDLVQQAVASVMHSAMPNQRAKPHIALIALDRQITRRISALLHLRGIRVVDETGWALSTTTAAAQLMAWLEAMAHDASTDAALAALRFAADAADAVQMQAAGEAADDAAAAPWCTWEAINALEARARQKGQRRWAQVVAQAEAGVGDSVGGIPLELAPWQARFTGTQPLGHWLEHIQALLEKAGLWSPMQQDPAGDAVLQALLLKASQPCPELLESRFSYSQLKQWVRAVLESSRFIPAAAPQRDAAGSPQIVVTILPLTRVWGRCFDAALVPGADARRLSASPKRVSTLSASQRQLLGLMSPEAAAQMQAQAWQWLTQLPSVHVLWPQFEGDEALQKSSLLELLELEGRVQIGRVPMLPLRSSNANQALNPQPLNPPPLNPQFVDGSAASGLAATQGVVVDWQTLAPKDLSASHYADLRACPYRFYAKKLLGLREFSEFEERIHAGDYGTWVHGVLFRFHEALKRNPSLDRARTFDVCAQQQKQAMGLDEAAFVPFALVESSTREAYLAWLAAHQAQGIDYRAGEVKKAAALEVAGQAIALKGAIDRIDQDAAGTLWLLDYKTEGGAKTKQRITQAQEETQLAFYALLLQGGEGAESRERVESAEGIESAAFPQQVRAAYVNIADRLDAKKATQTHELTHLIEQRDALEKGIWSDLTRLAQGHPMRALGEGETCAYCPARGLCRKDF